MKNIISFLESTIESLSKIAGSVFKFSIALGGICVVIYALRVGHFPQGISLGDGLLFLLAAACFGLVYALFVICMLSLGIFMSPILRPVLRGIFWVVRMITRTDVKPAYELAGFHGLSVFFVFLALVFILGLGREDVSAYWGLPLLSIALYMFYSVAKDAGARYRRAERLLNATIDTPEKDMALRSGEMSRQKSTYLMCIVIIAVMPLFMSGVFGYLLNGSMRLAQVRVEDPTIYVKLPYSAMLPDELATSEVRTPEGYTAYRGTTVQFKGFGSMTVVSFPDKDRTRQLDIPNELLIVERQVDR
ncbi:hypothetical protein [Thauera sp. Sel9]|uniref:hypothetical protein n=1 Tax=Thauera sp. Sel9 TaxID=2974299 RepID=UPI0021E10D40|nr:hypothetical protein [Thauera sp. Sel9]MCV2219013.1 hypothetical protein [Thauera sp. Sel9]